MRRSRNRAVEAKSSQSVILKLVQLQFRLISQPSPRSHLNPSSHRVSRQQASDAHTADSDQSFRHVTQSSCPPAVTLICPHERERRVVGAFSQQTNGLATRLCIAVAIKSLLRDLLPTDMA
ncbi:hypothetical protein CRM22_008985 [Opisthorchis felineus]|uniref:Uncharacterized protein n=1 Tax=Opisthorchis felineus TaxID=147828 RepID=A0A4S2LFT6_OPIFE|nr:hypothetical protein CRM22_008985 [Opisthorchis felineus]